jgi:hypothetical protein
MFLPFLIRAMLLFTNGMLLEKRPFPIDLAPMGKGLFYNMCRFRAIK